MDDSNSKKGYQVGRGKPPPGSRFKKGQPSPNPRGRPKGSMSAAKMWERILSRPVGENVITNETNSREAIFLKAYHETLKGKLDNFEKLDGMRALGIGREEEKERPLSFTLKLEDDQPSQSNWDWRDDPSASDTTDGGTLN